MKKWMGILFVVFMLVGNGLLSSADESWKYVRVGLSTVNFDFLATVKSDDGFAIYQYSNGDVSRLESFAAITSAQVKVTGTKIFLLDHTGNELYSYVIGEMIGIGPVQIESTIWTLNETNYRGAMMFLKTTETTAQQISIMQFEQYLYGVVPREMPSYYPVEALKAQAVAARCFATLSGTVHKAANYDVCTTTHCQVYGGVAGEVAKCSQAVNETAGIYARVNGKPVSCYYSSNNGGYIESSKDIWSSDVSYLQSKADPYNPDNPWTASYPVAELETILKAQGFNIGVIKSVNILARTVGGSVVKIEFVGESGTAIFEKDKIRSVFGATRLKSLKFDITTGTNLSGEATTVFMKDSTAAAFSKVLSGFYALSSNGSAKTTTITELYCIGSDVTKKIAVNGNVVSSGVFTGLEVSGQGYGHGIGMSQTGAGVMAEQGKTYKEILTFYFPGIEVY